MVLLNEILMSFISGLVFASIYSIMSLGLTISWGTLKIFNFSHGVLITIGTYVTWYTLLPRRAYAAVAFPYPGLGSNYAVALILTILTLFLLGIIIERTTIQPLLPRPRFDVTIIIATIGATMIIQNIVLIIFSGRYRILPPICPGQLTLGFLAISFQKIVIILFSTLTLIFFHFFLKKNRFGMAIRAIEQDREAARLVGINNEKMFMLTLGLSGVLAGIAGMFLGNITVFTPSMGSAPLFKSFIIIVLGGLGSIKGNVAAAYIIGMLEAFTSLFLGVFWTLPIEFLVLMVILTLRPSGIFGVKEIMK